VNDKDKMQVQAILEALVKRDEIFDKRMQTLAIRDEALIARLETLTATLDRLVNLIIKSVS
jgi:hypothetical protein